MPSWYHRLSYHKYDIDQNDADIADLASSGKK